MEEKRVRFLKRLNKKTISILAFAVVLLIPIVAVAVNTVNNGTAESEATEIDDLNPELEWQIIDSDAEYRVNQKPTYTPVGSYSQNGSTYNISTNAYVAWNIYDDIGYAYKSYNVGSKKEEWLEAEVTLDKPAVSNNGNALQENSSVGLIFRESSEKDSASVFLHMRGTNVVVVYRTDTGSATKGGTCETTVQWSGYTSCTFPVTLKMRKEGNIVRCYFKSAAYGNDWVNFRYPVSLNANTSTQVGLAAHSCDEATQIQGQFSNLKITGHGLGTQSSSEDEPTVEEIVDEVPPATDDMLLYETFSDGSLTEGEESVSNPVWDDPQYTTIKNIDGNRVWERDFADSTDLVGSREWTDYSTSVDIQFTENCNPDPEAAQNAFRLYTRYKHHDAYGDSGYVINVSEGYKIELYKASYNVMTLPSEKGSKLLKSYNLREILGDENYSCLGDGKWHNLRVDTFDNIITIYWDNELIGCYTDDGTDTMLGEKVYSYGMVGVGTYQTSVYIDNLIVKKLEDEFGGDYDNKIGGNWNDPIPDYVKDYYKY